VSFSFPVYQERFLALPQAPTIDVFKAYNDDLAAKKKALGRH